MDDRVFSTWSELEHPPLHVDEPCNVLCYCSSFFETPACHADGNTKDEQFICIMTSYSIPEHPSQPFLNQTVWEHSGGLAWKADKESLRCNVQLVYWTYSSPALSVCPITDSLSTPHTLESQYRAEMTYVLFSSRFSRVTTVLFGDVAMDTRRIWTLVWDDTSTSWVRVLWYVTVTENSSWYPRICKAMVLAASLVTVTVGREEISETKSVKNHKVRVLKRRQKQNFMKTKMNKQHSTTATVFIIDHLHNYCLG